MNHFGLSGTKSGIDMSEVSSVREMIFSKARERAASLAAEKENKMTSSVQNDVMNSARASISQNKLKPFGNLTQNTKEVKPQEPEKIRDVSFEIPKLKYNVQSAENSVYTASMRDEVMNSARTQYTKRTPLIESLKFLNTQAAIKMVNSTHSKIK